MCERLHGFYYGCTDSFIRLAVNNGYLKFCVVGDSVTVSYCTVYSHDSTASTVEFEDDRTHSNPLVKTRLLHDMSQVLGLKISPDKLGISMATAG